MLLYAYLLKLFTKATKKSHLLCGICKLGGAVRKSRDSSFCTGFPS
jgi:hypothetical protein